MIEGIVIALITALISGLGYMFVKWMNETDTRLDDVATKTTQLVTRVDKLESSTVKTDECYKRSIKINRRFSQHDQILALIRSHIVKDSEDKHNE